MKKIEICAYPYASQTGTIEIPEKVTNIKEYIINHWDNIQFKEPELDYCGIDFEYYDDGMA